MPGQTTVAWRSRARRRAALSLGVPFALAASAAWSLWSCSQNVSGNTIVSENRGDSPAQILAGDDPRLSGIVFPVLAPPVEASPEPPILATPEVPVPPRPPKPRPIFRPTEEPDAEIPIPEADDIDVPPTLTEALPGEPIVELVQLEIPSARQPIRSRR